MGHVRKDVRVSVVLTRGLKERLEEVARARDFPASWCIRRAIVRWLEDPDG